MAKGCRAGHERCDDCGQEYADDGTRVRQCPRCAAIEDACFAIPVDIPEPRYWSQAAMKERLGISGREDS